MKFITYLKRLLPKKKIEKGVGKLIGTTKTTMLTPEGEFYIRKIVVANTYTDIAAIVNIYDGDPESGGVLVLRVVVPPANTIELEPNISITGTIFAMSNRDGIFLAISGEDYLI